jgi:predicted NUDIX family NTP pyrophosphohydrolase
MIKNSAGLLLYRFKKGAIEVLLVHPGGPFWAKKDVGSWSIPKGEIEEDEDPLKAAARETQEETGIHVHTINAMPLTAAKQKSGKIIYAWAIEGDFEINEIKSNLFEMEWPPKSGKKQFFAEVDKASWLTIDDAIRKIVPGQLPLINELNAKLEKRN